MVVPYWTWVSDGSLVVNVIVADVVVTDEAEILERVGAVLSGGA